MPPLKVSIQPIQLIGDQIADQDIFAPVRSNRRLDRKAHRVTLVQIGIDKVDDKRPALAIDDLVKTSATDDLVIAGTHLHGVSAVARDRHGVTRSAMRVSHIIAPVGINATRDSAVVDDAIPHIGFDIPPSMVP